MAFARSLPQKDPSYDAYRAKLSLLQILLARGYNLGEDAGMLNPEVKMKDAYAAFKKDVVTPQDTKYIHPQGFMSPLNVIFITSTSVASTLNSIMEQSKTSKRRTPKILHLLFVVDKPREVTAGEARTLGNNTLEILSYQRLIVNPLSHCRSPTRIEKLSRRERDTMLSSASVEGRILPGVLAVDPVVLFLDMGPGDIYRTTDVRVYTGQNATSIGYRLAPRGVVCSSEGCEKQSYTFRSPFCRECAL